MQPPTIILVDNDSPSRKRIREILEAARYEVAPLADMTLAETMLRTLKGRAVLLCALPAPPKNVLSFLAASRREYGTLPVVAYGNRASGETLVSLLRLGVADFIRKPVGPEALLESVGHAARRLALSLDDDQSERKSAAELAATKKELRAAHELSDFKSFMISMAAHDFRSILTVLDGYQQILRQNCDGSCEREIIPKMFEQSNRTIVRLQSMANTLFDIEASEAGKLRIELVPFDYRRLLCDCVSFYKPYAAQKGIDLSIDPRLPKMEVIGDPTRVQQIFDNLLYNAVKFTPANGRIVIGRREDRQGFETATVSDSGRGLPKAMIRELSGDSQTVSQRDQLGRIGLGLVICRRLVASQNGILTISSESGQGTVVSISLPKAE